MSLWGGETGFQICPMFANMLSQLSHFLNFEKIHGICFYQGLYCLAALKDQ